MFASGLVAIALAVAASEPQTSPSANDLKAYDAAKAQVGRNAEGHINLALWCEAHGLNAERLKHLALAVLIEPQNTKARALMGLIAFQGHWQRPEDVGKKIQADAEMANNLAEYNNRRARTPYNAEAHWRLALWCEQKGLKPEAVAHLTTVVRLDPKRDAAWKHLGYKRDKGRWVTDTQLATARAEAEAQKQADLRWRKQLETWKHRLGHSSTKADTLKALSEVTDPRAVPAIWATLVSGSTPKPALAAQLLGQIDSPLASKSLAYLGILSTSSDVRRLATETLKRRDPCEFAGIPIALIQDPIKYEVKHVEGPGSPGTLFVGGKKFDVKRQYTPATLPNFPMVNGDFITYDASGLPVLNRTVGYHEFSLSNYLNSINNLIPTASSIQTQLHHFQSQLTQSGASKEAQAAAQYFINNPPDAAAWMGIQSPILSYAIDQASKYKELFPYNPGTWTGGLLLQTAEVEQIPIGRMAVEAQKSAVIAEQQLENDVARIDRTNAEIARANKNALELLTGSTGQDFGPDRKAWDKWFADAQGYAFITNQSDSRPTVFEEVAPTVQPVPITFNNQVVGIRTHSCFAAGTEVATMTGRKAIETLRAGDRVLTWNTTTGSLAMQPILTVFHNPPSPTLRLEFEDDSIVTTPWHRFWLVGKGWVVARDLKPGDFVRTLERSAKIIAIAAGDAQPVFNLEVAEDHDFLVGRQGALVHDNSTIATVSVPFDSSPSTLSSATNR